MWYNVTTLAGIALGLFIVVVFVNAVKVRDKK